MISRFHNEEWYDRKGKNSLFQSIMEIWAYPTRALSSGTSLGCKGEF